MSSRGN